MNFEDNSSAWVYALNILVFKTNVSLVCLQALCLYNKERITIFQQTTDKGTFI